MKTRCKFRVTKVTEFDTGSQTPWRQQEITLEARYDEKKTEDQSFAEATPQGLMHFMLTNQALIDGYKVGQEYYIDLIPVE